LSASAGGDTTQANGRLASGYHDRLSGLAPRLVDEGLRMERHTPTSSTDA
jgi:hypothetical protein